MVACPTGHVDRTRYPAHHRCRIQEEDIEFPAKGCTGPSQWQVVELAFSRERKAFVVWESEALVRWDSRRTIASAPVRAMVAGVAQKKKQVVARCVAVVSVQQSGLASLALQNEGCPQQARVAIFRLLGGVTRKNERNVGLDGKARRRRNWLMVQ